MPEMPEVETIARKLRRTLPGRSVADVQLSGLPLRKPVAANLASVLRGRTVRKIHRRGKYLIIEMEPTAFWLIHLGMSGRLLFRKPPFRPARHTHALICFSDSTGLEYRDHRRFGLLAVYEVAGLTRIPELQSLGIDPLGRGFNPGWLRPRLKASRTDIKSFLLDQRNIAGLGNIYVCEALYQAGVRPSRRCFRLTAAETERLVHAIRTVLRLALRNRGTSFSDFIDTDGELGRNQKFLRVFQREGEECTRCGSLIRRMRQKNRSSFYCPSCQV